MSSRTCERQNTGSLLATGSLSMTRAMLMGEREKVTLNSSYSWTEYETDVLECVSASFVSLCPSNTSDLIQRRFPLNLWKPTDLCLDTRKKCLAHCKAPILQNYLLHQSDISITLALHQTTKTKNSAILNSHDHSDMCNHTINLGNWLKNVVYIHTPKNTTKSKSQQGPTVVKV